MAPLWLGVDLAGPQGGPRPLFLTVRGEPLGDIF